MVPAYKELECVVVTPERALLEESADFIAVTLYDGELGVLPGRAPLIGRLGFGELRLRKDNVVHRFYVDGGFVQVRDDVVTVLTPRAQKAEDIDMAAAREALAAAQVRAPTPEAQEAQFQAQSRARALLRVAMHVGSDIPAARG
jgi:F-type H+-transporting ATPase subunit epsilon